MLVSSIFERSSIQSYEFFCTVGRNLSVKIPQHPNPLLSEEYKINESDEQPAEFTFHAVDTVTIHRALCKMKKSFGFGSDGIASNFLKIAYPVISNSICDIFNFSIFSGSFPDSWKIARVAPIFKGGQRDDRSNYRPISVLPVVSRLFEKLIYDQLYHYLDKNRYLGSHQSGFRSLHSVVTCLLKATNDWYLDIDRGKYTAMIFIDLKKAFDTVDHQILLDKMQFYGITEETSSMVYKSLNSLAPQYLSDLFVRLSELHSRELRNSGTDLAIPLLRTANGQKSFSYRGASLWNSLDLDKKEAPSINAFRSKFKTK